MKKSILLMGVTLGVLASSLFGCSNELSNDELIIGMDCEYPPFSWAETTENEYTLSVSNASIYTDGYDVQIAKILGEKLNKPVTIIRCTWESLVPNLQNNSINVILAGMTETEERKETMDFSDEYYRSELVLVTKKTYADEYEGQTVGSDVLSTLLNGQVIISQIGTVQDDAIDVLKEQFGAEHGNAVLTFAACATDVSNGSAFAFTAEYPVAQSLVSAFSDLGIIHIEQTILGDLYAELGVSIAVKKGNTELVEELNSVLDEISQEEREQLMSEALARYEASEAAS